MTAPISDAPLPTALVEELVHAPSIDAVSRLVAVEIVATIETSDFVIVKADALEASTREVAAARVAAIDECLATIDALKGFVPVQGGRSRFTIYDLTRAFKAGISMAREDVEALRVLATPTASVPAREQEGRDNA